MLLIKLRRPLSWASSPQAGSTRVAAGERLTGLCFLQHHDRDVEPIRSVGPLRDGSQYDAKWFTGMGGKKFGDRGESSRTNPRCDLFAEIDWHFYLDQGIAGLEA